MMLVFLDFDAPEAVGGIWKSPYDFAPSRKLGCCGCYGYRVGRQLSSGCDGVDPQEGVFQSLLILTALTLMCLFLVAV